MNAEPFLGVSLEDVSPGSLAIEHLFYTSQLRYHDTELQNARKGLALVEAELARREKENAA